MTTTAIQAALAIGSGGVIGLVLGLVGGGGSILAVPLLVYLVGIPSPHVAIGTAAVAVALNAAFGLVAHARQGTVKWRCALVFAGAGIVGSAIGATAGKAVDGQRLLALFGGIMIVVALAMLHGARAWAYMDDRKHVEPEDLQTVLPAVIAHRLSPSGELGGASRSDLVARLLQQVAIP